MRHTFEQVKAWAKRQGVEVERMARPRMGCKYDVYRAGNCSNVEECRTLQEVIDAVPEFSTPNTLVVEPGSELDLLLAKL